MTSCEPYSDKECKYAYPERVKGQVVLPEMDLADGISIDRLDQRRSFAQQFNDEFRRIEQTQVVDYLDQSRRQAFDLLTSANRPNSPWRAFSVDDEDARLQDRYGRNLYGQSMLIARRLVESDVRFVTVTWGVFEKLKIDEDGWDTHQRNFHILRNHRLPVLDRAWSALCEDLDARGLLEETLIVVMGEMGRTPKVNARGGRDHWSFCHNVLLTIAGIKHGHVYGASDPIEAWPASDPVSPESLIATIYAAMGINTTTSIYDQTNRPHPVAQRGTVLDEILA